ncbi:hypothetical protein FQZ97_1055140 [compost metagenome]
MYIIREHGNGRNGGACIPFQKPDLLQIGLPDIFQPVYIFRRAESHHQQFTAFRSPAIGEQAGMGGVGSGYIPGVFSYLGMKMKFFAETISEILLGRL